MRLQPSALIDPVTRKLGGLPWRQGLQLAWQAVVLLGLTLLCLAVLAWLTLQWGILPHIEDWRPTIERHASQAVGVPVRIGHIAVRSSGWVPALDLRDVVLRDSSGAEALRLPHVSAALSPSSLVVLAPRLSQLYIEDARLLVRRDADGHLHVGGLDLAGHAATVARADGGATLDWFFSQQEFVLRGGTLRWVDEQRQAPPLELSGVDLVVRNGLLAHDLRLDATPPPEWGDRFTVRAQCHQPLFARAGDWRRWSGTLYGELPRGDVAQLKHHVDLPFELDGGQGAVRLWLDFQEEHWRSLTADLSLRDVGLRLADKLEPLAILKAGGRLEAQRSPTGVALSAEHFGFQTASGLSWPAGDMRVSWRQPQSSLSRHPAPAAGRGQHGGTSVRTVTIGAGATSAAASADPAPAASGLPWDADAPVASGQLTADHLDLTLMRQLAASLPLPAPTQRWLADYAPEGVVSGLSARWDGPIDAPAHYRASAAIAGLSIAAGEVPASGAAGRPGWRNATLNFDASETGGVAHLVLDQGAIELPGVFDEPVIPFDRFGATVSWRIAPGRSPADAAAVELNLRDVHFANADAEGDLQLQWHTGTGTAAATGPSASAEPAASAASPVGHGAHLPGLIDLEGVLSRANPARIARYLPQHIPHSTRDYLRAAFQSGSLSDVKFTVHGDLADFPYVRGRDGEFRIQGQVQDLAFDYVPALPDADTDAARAAWPIFTRVSGRVVLDRGALEFLDVRGRMGEVVLHDVHGGIASMYEKATLSLQGQATGPMPEFLGYVAHSPIGGWLHGGLAQATATGNADLTLGLVLPLYKAGDASVTGTLQLVNNDVRIVPDSPLLANAHARIDFNERGVSVSGGGARVFGGEASFDGGSQPDGSLRFNAQGSVGADGLRRATDDPSLARLAQRLGGQTAYRVQVGIGHGQTAIEVASSLAGLAVNLPAPLSKPADATWPLRVTEVLASDTAGHAHDVLKIDLSRAAQPVLQAELQRDLGGPVPRVQRAAYAVGAALPAPQAGGVAVMHAGALDADAWWALARGLGGGSTPAPTEAAGAIAPSTPSAFASYAPAAASLQAQDLLIGGRHLTHVDLQLARVESSAGPLWRANMTSEQTHGVVEYRLESPTRGAELFARLDRLALDSGGDSAAAASAPAGDGAKPNAMSQIPALDIVVDNFELDGRKLGKLEVAATLQPGARDWRLTHLAATLPEARFSGSGEWSGTPERRMSLDFKLELTDSGAFLDRLGMGHVLKGGKGDLSGSVAWTGSPLALDTRSLHGRLKLQLDTGQFLKADAGAARLLGVLSLQSLPRRLTLDFRDIFQEGFAFDNVTGDVLVDKGVATTRDLRMRGVSAAVLMEGSADIQAETQDLRVIVVPDVNAGAASLAYAAVNPIIGIGTFLAQLFLRNPLAEAGTREFHVVGSWADPKVDEVDHKEAVEAAARARAAEASAPAASAVD